MTKPPPAAIGGRSESKIRIGLSGSTGFTGSIGSSISLQELQPASWTENKPMAKTEHRATRQRLITDGKVMV
ncbi:hypothetical protein, partial [uncultured Parabacteroides sp.]|uniref:hypothetical protein n=1 Tax=uncultured Parabacteroides sp. TaxID=512312 RepID=UPI002675AE0E